MFRAVVVETLVSLLEQGWVERHPVTRGWEAGLLTPVLPLWVCVVATLGSEWAGPSECCSSNRKPALDMQGILTLGLP